MGRITNAVSPDFCSSASRDNGPEQKEHIARGPGLGQSVRSLQCRQSELTLETHFTWTQLWLCDNQAGVFLFLRLPWFFFHLVLLVFTIYLLYLLY